MIMIIIIIIVMIVVVVVVVVVVVIIVIIVGKRQMGSALMGSLQSSFLSTEGLLGYSR